ncbi:MAG: response regulator transcription factor [Pseudomonadota bacterium]|nr:response regulator transcription factor [Pseudomonadota bacterium]
MDPAARTKVFIVDDSPSIRAGIGEMLGRVAQACVVGEAQSPSEAIAGIRATQPDLVILDLHLAGGTGIEVLRAVHPEAPEITFVVLTNYPTPQYRRICMAAGATHFLDKSHEFERINELVQCNARAACGPAARTCPDPEPMPATMADAKRTPPLTPRDDGIPSSVPSTGEIK